MIVFFATIAFRPHLSCQSSFPHTRIARAAVRAHPAHGNMTGAMQAVNITGRQLVQMGDLDERVIDEKCAAFCDCSCKMIRFVLCPSTRFSTDCVIHSRSVSLCVYAVLFARLADSRSSSRFDFGRKSARCRSLTRPSIRLRIPTRPPRLRRRRRSHRPNPNRSQPPPPPLRNRRTPNRKRHRKRKAAADWSVGSSGCLHWKRTSDEAAV